MRLLPYYCKNVATLNYQVTNRLQKKTIKINSLNADHAQLLTVIDRSHFQLVSKCYAKSHL